MLRPLQWGGLGFIGVPIAMGLQRWLSLFFTVAVVLLGKYHKDAWFGWSLADMCHAEGLKSFWRLGIPAGLSVLSEAFGCVACVVPHGFWTACAAQIPCFLFFHTARA